MTPLRSLSFVLIGLLIAAAGGGVFAQGEGPASPAGPAVPESPAALPGTGFTYQGELQDGGGPVTGNCDFEFRLYDALTLGAQQGSTQTLLNLPLENGRFTARLNTSAQFGPRAFDGSGRWLDISVRCPTGVGGFTPLTPRQPLLPSPLAFALPGLRTEYSGLTTPNVIGGHISNTVGVGVVGATIGGGGSAADPNSVSADYGTVGGGRDNDASGSSATVGGGTSNDANNSGAMVGGGLFNTASGSWSTVGGGESNVAGGPWATVGGGEDNTAIGNWATVGGGQNNIAFENFTVIGGGQDNLAFGFDATISGGRSNSTSGNYATVGGGHFNAAAGTATVAGGENNTASGSWSTVGGGRDNTASGSNSFAAGREANAVHSGAFVWADSTGVTISSTVANQFLVRASGGVTMYTDSDATTGVRVPPGGGSWTSVSDRNAKANFAPVDGVAVLDALMGIPIETWNYQAQAASIRHMGPMAQDFYAAFGLGETDTGISTVDADGVALAAIQGLYTVVQEQQAENAALRERVAALEAAGVETSAPGETAHRAVSTSAALPWLLLAGLGLLNLGGAAGYAAARHRQR